MTGLPVTLLVVAKAPEPGRAKTRLAATVGDRVAADIAAAAGWRVVELDVSYGPRTGGKSKVSGSLRGSITAILDFWKVIS